MKEEIDSARKWIGENLNDARANDWFEAATFTQNIQPVLPAILKLISLPPSYDEGKYNCFVYALGLHQEAIFLRKEKRPDLAKVVIINSPQITELLRSFEKTDTPVDGDYVFYKNGNIFAHAGIYLGEDVVESKWSDGPVFRHPIRAVHPGYGEEILFYRKSDPQKIKDLLIEMDTDFKNRSSVRR